MQKKLKPVILVLGLLQVVSTVKTKGTEISTGPTTSSRHSKNKLGTEISTGPTTSSRHSKNKLGTEISTGPTTSSRHGNSIRHSF